jgi:hypothetical protein
MHLYEVHLRKDKRGVEQPLRGNGRGYVVAESVYRPDLTSVGILAYSSLNEAARELLYHSYPGFVPERIVRIALVV